jgi:hypothetical protein
LTPSPVNPSIARGVVISVVNVAFCGNFGGSAQAETQLEAAHRKIVNESHLNFITLPPLMIATIFDLLSPLHPALFTAVEIHVN